MRRTFLVLLTAAALVHASEALNACGDKFTVLGRLSSWQHAYSPVYPADVVIDVMAGARASKPIQDPKFAAALKLAGHQVSRVENRAMVEDAIRSGKVDVVLADFDEASRLARLAGASTSQTIVLPVMADKPAKAVVDSCRAEFGDRCQLKASDKPERFLRVMDDAMRVRAKARAAQKR